MIQYKSGHLRIFCKHTVQRLGSLSNLLLIVAAQWHLFLQPHLHFKRHKTFVCHPSNHICLTACRVFGSANSQNGPKNHLNFHPPASSITDVIISSHTDLTPLQVLVSVFASVLNKLLFSCCLMFSAVVRGFNHIWRQRKHLSDWNAASFASHVNKPSCTFSRSTALPSKIWSDVRPTRSAGKILDEGNILSRQRMYVTYLYSSGSELNSIGYFTRFFLISEMNNFSLAWNGEQV